MFLTVSLSIAAAPAALCSSEPSPRLACRLVYDPVNERLMMFGGIYEGSQAQVFGDTWILDLSGESTDWRLAGAAAQPEASTPQGIAGFPPEAVLLGALAVLLLLTPRSSLRLCRRIDVNGP